MISQRVVFILVVGVGSTLVIDLWAQIAARLGWRPAAHWPSVGRWLLGLPRGRLVLDGADPRPFSGLEAATGWLFHYLVGLAYAAMFPLVWGMTFLQKPTLLPVFLIGVVVPTFAGLGVLVPALGGGFFARKIANPLDFIIYVLVSHGIFATAQYLLARALA